jgi:hypothetical protein
MSTFPMIAVDGTTADVPEASVAVALSKGAKHAVQMQAPDGSRAYVPLEASSAARQRGAIPVDQLPDVAARAAGAQTPTSALAFDPRKVKLPTPPPVDQLAEGGLRLSELALPALRTAASLPIAAMGNLGKDPAVAAMQMGAQVGANIATQPTATSKVGAAAGTLLGLDVPAIQDASEKAGKTGEYTPLAGESVAGVGQGALMARGASRASASSSAAARVPIEQLSKGTLDNLRKVANPDVNDLHFDAKFMKHGGEAISQFEQTNGHLPQTAHELGTAFLDSAKANRELYYGKMISSVESDPLSTPNGYNGAKLTPGTASVRQLDARLTDINNTLEPKFARGGPGSQQAQAAVGAGEARALKAEAASIRAILYPYLGQRLGLTAEQVGGIRDSFGAQRHIGETILISENERFARTAGKEMTPKGLTVNPLSNTKEFVLDKALNAMRSSESPADRAVREAMAQVRTGGMQRPTPNVQPPQSPPQRTPPWQTNEIDQPQSSITVSTPEQITANEQRILQNRLARPTQPTIKRPLPLWKSSAATADSGTPSAPIRVKPPTAPPKPDEMIDSLRFRINDLSTKLRKADASEKGEIEAELSRTKEMINSLSPRAKESAQSLKPQGEPSTSYRTPESVMLAMKSGTLSQTEGNRLLQKLRGKSHAVTRPIPPPP